MGMTTGNGPPGLQSEINVTPLVDVVLVLLIIFMVIIPLTMRGYDMSVPGGVVTAPEDEPRQEQIVLGIDLDGCPVTAPPAAADLPPDCRVTLNDDELPVAELTGRIAEIYRDRAPEDRVLFLAAHDRLNYEAVMRIVDRAKAGVEALTIGLVMRAEGPGPDAV